MNEHPEPPKPPQPQDDLARLKPAQAPAFPRQDAFLSSTPRFTPQHRMSHRPAYHAAIASTASQALHELGGTNTMFRSDANGGRPVALLIPPKADRNKPFELVLFFHGKGTQLDELLNNPELEAGVKEQARSQPNVIFAFPQGHSRERYHLWMSHERGESLARLRQEIQDTAARILGKDKITIHRFVLKAHSSGGVVCKNALDAGELQANHIDLYDAMYGNWGDMVAEWALRPENQSVDFGVVYSPHQQAQVRSFRKTLTGQRVMHIERAKVGHSQLPFHYWVLRPGPTQR